MKTKHKHRKVTTMETTREEPLYVIVEDVTTGKVTLDALMWNHSQRVHTGHNYKDAQHLAKMHRMGFRSMGRVEL